MSHHSDGHGDEQDHEFECDYPGCSSSYVGFGRFSGVWDAAHDDGWRAFKDDDGDWQHRCPDHTGMD